MIDVKQAIANAEAYAQDLLGTSDLLLEEVGSDDERFHITLSFPARDLRPMLNPLLRGRQEPREFKRFDVDKESGEVVGMMIRQIA